MSISATPIQVAQSYLKQMESRRTEVAKVSKDFILDALEAFEHKPEPVPVDLRIAKRTPTFASVGDDLKELASGQSEKIRERIEQIRNSLWEIPKLIEQDKAMTYLNGLDLKELLAMKLKEEYPDMDNEVILESIKEYMNV